MVRDQHCLRSAAQLVMASNDQWPEAAYTSNDMQAFCKMLKARSKSASDVGWWLHHDLDELWNRARTNDEVEWNDTTLQSFLLQIDQCGDILTSLPDFCERVLKMKIETNGEDCNCAIKFGGESWKDSMENAVRAANSTSEGCQLQTFVMNHLLSDQTSWYSKERSASTFTLERLFCFFCCLRSAVSEISHVRDHLFLCFWFWCVVSFGLFRGFNIFMNRYSFDEDLGISMHTDAQAAYEEKDPITSISIRNGSLLMVSAKQKKGKGRGQRPRWCLLIYQPPNSMVVMGGRFQSQFLHAVSSFDDMKMLVQRETGDQCTWKDEHGHPIYVLWAQGSKLRMKEELQRLATVNLTLGRQLILKLSFV